MINQPNVEISDAKQLLMWFIAVVVFFISFRFVKDIIVFVLDELYRMFIQHQG
jgi:hypothetical protein